MIEKSFFIGVFALLAFSGCPPINAQTSASLVFYNSENLFDTLADPAILDRERTPSGLYRWNGKRYRRKLNLLSELFMQLDGNEKQGPSLIGLCEIENAGVLHDLVKTKSMSTQNYGWIHHDSPDRRGIDVALLYRKKDFLPLHFNAHRLLLEDEKGYRIYTRDQLVIRGVLGEEEITLLLVHWPSRRGGKARSAPLRQKAAELSRRIVDSLQTENPKQKIIIMGDFNDNPTDSSLKGLLQGKYSGSTLLNPMQRLFKKGLGTVAYRDEWALFDQIIISQSLTGSPSGWSAQNVFIHCPSALINKKGRYKGYPFRTFAGTIYQGGYSDHLPVGIKLLWQKKTTNTLVLGEPELPRNTTENE